MILCTHDLDCGPKEVCSPSDALQPLDGGSSVVCTAESTVRYAAAMHRLFGEKDSASSRHDIGDRRSRGRLDYKVCCIRRFLSVV